MPSEDGTDTTPKRDRNRKGTGEEVKGNPWTREDPASDLTVRETLSASDGPPYFVVRSDAPPGTKDDNIV